MPFVDQVAQVGELVALLERQLLLGHAPGLGELGARGRVGDLLIARVQVGQHAHIAGALDVVLATHGARPELGLPIWPATQAMEAMVCTVFRFCFCWHTPMPQPMMAKASPCVHLGSLVDQRGFDTRDVLYGFGSVVLDGLPPLVKAVRVLGDEFLVVEAIVDQAVGKGVEERDIATVLDRKVDIGDTRGFDMARVGDNDLATLFFGSHDTPCDDGVRIGRVIAEEENAARILHTGDGA